MHCPPPPLLVLLVGALLIPIPPSPSRIPLLPPSASELLLLPPTLMSPGATGPPSCHPPLSPSLPRTHYKQPVPPSSAVVEMSHGTTSGAASMLTPSAPTDLFILPYPPDPSPIHLSPARLCTASDALSGVCVCCMPSLPTFYIYYGLCCGDPPACSRCPPTPLAKASLRPPVRAAAPAYLRSPSTRAVIVSMCGHFRFVPSPMSSPPGVRAYSFCRRRPQLHVCAHRC